MGIVLSVLDSIINYMLGFVPISVIEYVLIISLLVSTISCTIIGTFIPYNFLVRIISFTIGILLFIFKMRNDLKNKIKDNN